MSLNQGKNKIAFAYLDKEKFWFTDKSGTFVSLERQCEHFQGDQFIRSVYISLPAMTKHGATKAVTLRVVRRGN